MTFGVIIPVAGLTRPPGKSEAQRFASTLSSGRSYFLFPKNLLLAAKRKEGFRLLVRQSPFLAGDRQGVGWRCGDRPPQLCRTAPLPSLTGPGASVPGGGEDPSSHPRLGGLHPHRCREEILELLFVFFNLKIDSGEEKLGVV